MYLSPDDFTWKESVLYEDVLFAFKVYFALCDEMKGNETELILFNSVNEVKEKIVKRLNDVIKFNWPNKEDKYNYFITEDRLDLTVAKYSLSGQSDGRCSTVIIRAELKELIGIDANKNIGNLLYCDSYLLLNDEITRLTANIPMFKFFFSTGLHLFDRNAYEIAKRLAQIETFSFNFPSKGALFTREEYSGEQHDLVLSTNGEPYKIAHFTVMEGTVTISNNYVLIKDRSLGIFAIAASNLEAVNIIDGTDWLALVLVVKDRSGLPMGDVIEKDILLVFHESTLMSRRLEFKNYLRNTHNAVLYSDNFYEHYVSLLIQFRDHNFNYIANSFNLTNIHQYLRKQLALEKTEHQVPLFTSKFDHSSKPAIIINTGILNSGAETMSAILKESAGTFFRKVHLVTVDNIGEIKNILFKDNLTILTVRQQCSFIEIIGCIDLEKVMLVATCYSVNLACFTSDKGREEFNGVKNILDSRLCNFVLVDDSTVHEDTVAKKMEILGWMRKEGVFNKRAFTKNSKEVKVIFENRMDVGYLEELLRVEGNNLSDLGSIVKINQVVYWEKTKFLDFLKLLNIPWNFKESKKIEKVNRSHKLYGMLMEEEMNFHKLIDETNKAKLASEAMVIVAARGRVAFLEEKGVVYEFERNYNLNVTNKGEWTKECYIDVQGRNIDREVLEQYLMGLNSKIPQLLPMMEKLSEEEEESINLGMLEEDLPDGWTLDTFVFVNEEGERFRRHPCRSVNRFE